MSDDDLRPAEARDRATLEAWFRAAPVEHCFLLTQLENHGLVGFHVLGDPPVAGAYVRTGRLLVPFGPRTGGRELARSLAGADIELRYVVGPLELVDEFWAGIRDQVPEPTWLRRNRLYAMESKDLLPATPPAQGRLRASELGDLPWLARASSSMDREDRGVDPLEEDPVGLERYIMWLVHEGLVFVWEEGGRLLFKAQAACLNRRAALVEGVYTVPEARGRGVGTHAMRALCRGLLGRAPLLTLYVNEANTPAVRLYETVGFRHVGHYRSVLFSRQVAVKG
ncbi:MAG: GNAT family N-acetyltransferase [Candidatus Eisenbacteria bacterium]|nr:GNAT family N-acetyltransferase [Candidatus Eisenbacteria bacterium]